MIEVGKYIRTKQGEIGKIIRIIPDEEFNDEYYVCDNDSASGLKSYIIKHSKNIIDLIEVRRYSNIR